MKKIDIQSRLVLILVLRKYAYTESARKSLVGNAFGIPNIYWEKLKYIRIPLKFLYHLIDVLENTELDSSKTSTDIKTPLWLFIDAFLNSYKNSYIPLDPYTKNTLEQIRERIGKSDANTHEHKFLKLSVKMMVPLLIVIVLILSILSHLVNPPPLPTPTPIDPLPSLQQFKGLKNIQAKTPTEINGISVASNYIWFATDTGVIALDHNLSINKYINELNDLSILGSNPYATNEIWLGRKSACNYPKTIDKCLVILNTIDFTYKSVIPKDNKGQTPSGYPVAVSFESQSQLWVAFSAAPQVWHQKLDTIWESETPTNPVFDTDNLVNPVDLVISATDESRIWLTQANSEKKYVFSRVNDGNLWNAYEFTTWSQRTYDSANKMRVDSLGRVWFGHDDGLTIVEFIDKTPKWTECNWQSSLATANILSNLANAKITGKIINFSISKDNRRIWIITVEGLVMAQLSTDDLSDCSKWNWYWWENPKELSSPFKHIVLEQVKDEEWVWLAAKDTSDVYYLQWKLPQ